MTVEDDKDASNKVGLVFSVQCSVQKVLSINPAREHNLCIIVLPAHANVASITEIPTLPSICLAEVVCQTMFVCEMDSLDIAACVHVRCRLSSSSRYVLSTQQTNRHQAWK